MSSHQDNIRNLEDKLEILLSKQEGFAKELMGLYKEIDLLKKDEISTINKPIPTKETIVPEKIDPVQDANSKTLETPQNTAKIVVAVKNDPIQKPNLPKEKSNVEKFIGENLINKIGILITVIGVIIGAKYSIENNLISPLTRIILGYIMGLALLVFGMKLKAKYESYSAVLVSGAITILYFITFAAYSLYGLFSQAVAFVFMLVFTVFAVVASLNYSKQIIAHMGLVGAYAVPFLLSSGSGDVLTLFSYMTIINIGILIIAFKKYWKPLYYVAFAFTWLIYFSWVVASYVQEKHFSIAFSFLIVFFLIFYLVFMGYKLIKKEQFNFGDIVILFLNSFIFYGLGYYLLSDNITGEQLLGIFTLGNAVLHFIFAAIIFKQKLADKKLFYLIAAFVLTFITITIPVQLDGNWVSLLWAVEAALLFWIGLTKEIPIYKKLSYILIGLAFFSSIQDWSWSYDFYNYDYSENSITPFLNVNFLSSILVTLCFGFITWLNIKRNTVDTITNNIEHLMSLLIPVLLLMICYFTFFVEIDLYWQQLFNDSMVSVTAEDGYKTSYYNYDLSNFKSIWLLNYSLLFFTILSFINMHKVKSKVLGVANLIINLILIFAFLTYGLYIISELRSSYLEQNLAEYFDSGKFNLIIRYVSFIFLGGLLFAIHKYNKQPFIKGSFKTIFEIVFHFTIVWVLSSELLHWMDIAGYLGSYKMNLSIHWGAYSLFLVSLGIWKRKKHLRIAGIALFGVTLVKLFFYDIADLDTISKTIVFVSLGLLLLVISFLYNKYTKHIENDIKN